MMRTMLITGVSRGLGRAFADASIRAGFRVVGTVRSARDAEAAAARGIAPVLLDLVDREMISGAAAEAEAIAGPVDILVNNAGFGHEGAIEESSDDALRRQFEVNVFAPVALIRAVLPGMRERRRGHIVNVTSMAGNVAFAGVAYYCGSKFAMEGISEALGKEVKPFGVHVTAFALGQFRTDWAGSSMERSPRAITDYDSVIDPLRKARLDKDGRQPGDPAKAAEVLLAVLRSPNPPARVLVGPDAATLVGQKLKRVQAELGAWDGIARSTDFDLSPMPTPSSD